MDLYCTFKLNNEIYGINVSDIQEIINVPKFTNVPRSKSYLKGVFSLRGQVVTNICLSTLFNKNSDQQFGHSLVIHSNSDPLSINVNEILDIIEISTSDIEPIPDSIPDKIKQYLIGIKKNDEQIITILDVNKIEI